MKKHLIMVLMAAFAAFTFCSCGDDELEPTPNENTGVNDNNNQNGNQNGNQSDKISAAIRNTKWMGVVDCNDYVKIAVGTYNDYKLVDSLMYCHDTIYYDFGVDVSYPTYTKKTYLYESNKWEGSIDMWFDYNVNAQDSTISIGFRSNPAYDTNTRELKVFDESHMHGEERGVKYELTRIK